MIFQTTISWAGTEREVTVHYVHHKATKGKRDSLDGIRGAGPPLEPDYSGWIEIESVFDKAEGNEYLLNDYDLDLIRERILEDLGDE